MQKRVDMICVAFDLLVAEDEKRIMSEVAKQLPVLTCTNYEIQDKERYQDFSCLVQYDELAAFSKEQVDRNFKKKHVVIIHNNKSVLRRAASMGYICIEISDFKMKEDYVDYQFTSLNAWYDYDKRIDKRNNTLGVIMFVVAIILIYLCANDYIMDNYMMYIMLFITAVETLLGMYFFQVRKIRQIILYVLDLLF